jgi:REP element-mobilizing transposase RayT
MNGLGYDGMARKSRRGTQKTCTSALPAQAPPPKPQRSLVPGDTGASDPPFHGPHRVWQRRFYDLNVWSEKKTSEKLDYMHNNPAKRGLVASPDQWPWSSFSFYYLKDSSVLAMDRFP